MLVKINKQVLQKIQLCSLHQKRRLQIDNHRHTAPPEALTKRARCNKMQMNRTQHLEPWIDKQWSNIKNKKCIIILLSVNYLRHP